MDVSFLLPTAREISHPTMLDECIESIRKSAPGLDYEILVYSQNRVKGDRVAWIKEEVSKGPIHGFNLLASSYARGEYIVCITDDHLIEDPIELCLNYAENVFLNRKYKIVGLKPCGATPLIPKKGQTFGSSLMDQELPSIPILRFPVIRQDALALLGCVFNSGLFYHAGDIWLGYFLYMNGEPSFEGPTQVTPNLSLKNVDHEVADCDTVRGLINTYSRRKIPYSSVLPKNS
jgi:hypothetical protein